MILCKFGQIFNMFIFSFMKSDGFDTIGGRDEKKIDAKEVRNCCNS